MVVTSTAHAAAPGRPAPGPAAAPMPVDDPQRVRALRRMKAAAAGLLLLAAVIYAMTFVVGRSGGVWGFVRAGAEAGMVGGLADWFAVTALFRRPLGLPIPHTALIPTRKDALGASLRGFVGENFLSEEVVRRQLATAAVPHRVGRWLAEPGRPARLAAEATRLLGDALRLWRAEDLAGMVGRALTRRLTEVPLAPPVGRLLEPVVAGGAHHRLVDLVVTRLHAWLHDRPETVIALILERAPGWSPRFLDERVALKAQAELERYVLAVRDDPDHQLRRQLDAFLLSFAGDLQHDRDTIERTDQLVRSLLARDDVSAAFADLVTAARQLVEALLADDAGELQARIAAAIEQGARRMTDDAQLAAVLDSRLADAASYVVRHYRDEITTVISDTVERWDGDQAARRIELVAGRDLQFIRVNGTVVGALAGLAIHAISLAL